MKGIIVSKLCQTKQLNPVILPRVAKGLYSLLHGVVLPFCLGINQLMGSSQQSVIET